MPLRLLTKNEVQQNKDRIRDEQVVLGANLARQVDTERQNLNKIRDEHRASIDQMNRESARLFEEKEKERRQLDTEIKKLTIERERLMKPVDELLAEAKRIKDDNLLESERLKLDEARNKQNLEYVKAIASRNDREEERLQDFKKDLMKRGTILAKNELEYKESSDKLVKSWVIFNKKLLEENNRLEVRETQLIQREKSLAVLEDENKRDREAIFKVRLRLESQQQALQAGLQELKKLKSK